MGWGWGGWEGLPSTEPRLAGCMVVAGRQTGWVGGACSERSCRRGRRPVRVGPVLPTFDTNITTPPPRLLSAATWPTKEGAACGSSGSNRSGSGSSSGGSGGASRPHLVNKYHVMMNVPPKLGVIQLQVLADGPGACTKPPDSLR